MSVIVKYTGYGFPTVRDLRAIGEDLYFGSLVDDNAPLNIEIETIKGGERESGGVRYLAPDQTEWTITAVGVIEADS